MKRTQIMRKRKVMRIKALLIISIVTSLLVTIPVFADEVEQTAVIVAIPKIVKEDNMEKRHEQRIVENTTIHQEIIEPEFSSEDIMKLTCLVYAESRNQTAEGQISVAAVAINRKRDNSQFVEEETISEVIFAKSAFASIKNIDFSKAKEIGCYDAVIEAINEEDPTEELLWKEAERLGLDPEIYAKGGALYFYNPDYCSDEELQKRANIKCWVRIGDHIFYKVWDQ